MNLLLNLLKAFGIVVCAYLLLFAGTLAIWTIHIGTKDVGSTDTLIAGPGEISIIGSILILVLPVLAILGALYLPPKGRMYATIAGLSLLLGILICVGIQVSKFSPD